MQVLRNSTVASSAKVVAHLVHDWCSRWHLYVLDLAFEACLVSQITEMAHTTILIYFTCYFSCGTLSTSSLLSWERIFACYIWPVPPRIGDSWILPILANIAQKSIAFEICQTSALNVDVRGLALPHISETLAFDISYLQLIRRHPTSCISACRFP
jgi:hypothetical protein